MGNLDKTAMAARQKKLEHTTRTYIAPRTYTLIRVDGKAFHSFTRRMNRPYDTKLIACMQETARALCEAASGCVLAYTQSDEISLLLTDFATPTTQAWFGGNVQKMASITAAVATATFNREAAQAGFAEGVLPTAPALFDSRVWSVSDPVAVAEYFRWRQADAERNSVAMLAQAYFPHKELQNCGVNKMLDMLVNTHSVNWNNEPASFKRGSVVVRREKTGPVTYTDKRTGETHTLDNVTRRAWEVEESVIFTRDPFLTEIIPVMPALDLSALQQTAR